MSLRIGSAQQLQAGQTSTAVGRDHADFRSTDTIVAPLVARWRGFAAIVARAEKW
jgi:hypothetical protein